VSYQFTWARNPKWSKYYSGSAEIWQYLNDIVEKYGLKSYMKFNHTVVSATWNNDDGLWNVRVRDSEGVEIIDTCDVLINGSGHLKQVKLGWNPRSWSRILTESLILQ
jgi:cation diffusion facilitator CzcD-associated flavoprotein CzcO